MERGRDGEDALVSRVDELFVDILDEVVLRRHVQRGYSGDKTVATNLGESRELVVDRTDRLLNGLLERAANAHDFTDGLHATAQ